MEWQTIHISETDSTNRWLKEHGGDGNMVVWTEYQTAGRGCGSNTWESERGKNLLFSVLCHPVALPASEQFVLLEAQSVALKRVLSRRVDGISIKWPNDMYWRDRKISGTLSECRLQGALVRDCILGTGLNLNQERFVSDAPNPVSLRQITGEHYSAADVLEEILDELGTVLESLTGTEAPWREEYKAALYRRTGYYCYRDEAGEFVARLEDVEHDGYLVLMDIAGQKRRYAFKEVSFAL